MRKAPSPEYRSLPAGEIVLRVLRHRYADFSGRASRREYWVFVVFYLLGMTVLKSFARVNPNLALVQMVFFLALVVPVVAAGVRRLHDLEKPGWWLLVAVFPVLGALALLVMFCTEGTRGRNRFGPDPLRPERTGTPKPYYGDGFDELVVDPPDDSG